MAPGEAVVLIKGDVGVVNKPLAFVTTVTSCKCQKVMSGEEEEAACAKMCRKCTIWYF